MVDKTDREARAGAVFWIMITTGLEGAEAEQAIDQDVESLPPDRIAYARRNARALIKRQQRLKAERAGKA